MTATEPSLDKIAANLAMTDLVHTQNQLRNAQQISQRFQEEGIKIQRENEDLKKKIAEYQKVISLQRDEINHYYNEFKKTEWKLECQVRVTTEHYAELYASKIQAECAALWIQSCALKTFTTNQRKIDRFISLVSRDRNAQQFSCPDALMHNKRHDAFVYSQQKKLVFLFPPSLNGIFVEEKKE